MGASPSPAVTQLLVAWSGGDQGALEQLMPAVYAELKRQARWHLAGERSHTLQPTALVHEAYLRLVGSDNTVRWDGRGHFFGAAARAMRRILVERARSRGRIKRGGDRGRVELTDVGMAVEPPATDLVALDEALDRLEKHDPRKAEVVMLRYFAGLTIEETAAALSLSAATIKTEWAFARAWLHREISTAQGAAEAAS
jgi:RNA polymerase sigma factor (TIGR02999 family)